jgi:hypothetical protein
MTKYRLQAHAHLVYALLMMRLGVRMWQQQKD